MNGFLRFRRRLLPASLVAVSCAALLLASAAPADTSLPVVALGPLTIANGTATLSGSLGPGATASTIVTVDGRALSVDANGNFTGTVDLGGRTTLDLTVTSPTGETSTISIPLTTSIGPGGVIPATVLDALRQAGVTLTIPPGGFATIDEQALRVLGSVVDPRALSSLTVNGKDALSLLQPDGTFAVTVPGTEKAVTVTATDTKGVSETRTFPVHTFSSTVTTKAGTSVAATGAVGVTIAGVKYTTRGVKARKRITVAVTVKDRRGYLVRGARVKVRAVAFQHHLIVGRQQAKSTNTVGRASFTLKLRGAKFNKARRLFTVVQASTPSSSATRTTSVRVPKLVNATTRR
jgi:hypothetical protein